MYLRWVQTHYIYSNTLNIKHWSVRWPSLTERIGHVAHQSSEWRHESWISSMRGCIRFQNEFGNVTRQSLMRGIGESRKSLTWQVSFGSRTDLQHDSWIIEKECCTRYQSGLVTRLMKHWSVRWHSPTERTGIVTHQSLDWRRASCIINMRGATHFQNEIGNVTRQLLTRRIGET